MCSSGSLYTRCEIWAQPAELLSGRVLCLAVMVIMSLIKTILVIMSLIKTILVIMSLIKTILVIMSTNLFPSHTPISISVLVYMFV